MKSTAATPANGDVLFEMGYVPNSGGDIGWCLGLSVVSSSKGAGTTYTNLTPSYACSFQCTRPASEGYMC